jgi:hypothetical protein
MTLGFGKSRSYPKDHYKTAFTVPFGQHEWNVMPFGFKNAPSEFQRIMNDIFNAYSKFCIVYIECSYFFNIIRTTLKTLTNIFSCYKIEWFSCFQIKDFSIPNSCLFSRPLYIPRYHYTY